MPNPNYESLSPNGHETMITRIFQKLINTFQKKTEEMSYDDYLNLTQEEIMDGTERFLTGVTSANYFYYEEATKTLWFVDGVTTYDENSKTLWL